MNSFQRLTILIVVIAVLVLTMIGKESRLAAAPEEASEMKTARQRIAENLGMMYNDDNVDAQTETPEQFLSARLRPMAHTQIDVVTFDPCDVDNIAIYPSEVLEFTKVYPLAVAGHDPVALALQFCHDNGLQFYPSFRMNDVHESLHKDWWRTAQWKRDHPEYLMGRHGDNTRYPLSSPRAWWAAKDYAVPAVRERQFLLIQEVCQNYDVDGIELDFFRDPLYFRPTLDLRPVTAEHVQIMNNFMRRIRAMTEQVSRQRGRPLLVAARVPMSVERSRAIGLDLQTWLEQDLVDLLIVGGGYAPMAMAPQVRRMVHFAGRYNVPVYACISASGMKEHHDCVEAWRGAAMNIYRVGARVYLFNFPYGLLPPGADASYHVYHSSPQQIQLYKELGSPETLKGLDKMYGIDYFVKDTFFGSMRPGLVVPGRLPVELDPGQWTRLHLPVGEDVVANAPEDKSTHTRLLLRVSGVSSGDKVNVKLNGEALPHPITPSAQSLTADLAIATVHLVMYLQLPDHADAVQARTTFDVGPQWKEYHTWLDIGQVAESLSLEGARIRAIVQIYSPTLPPTDLYVDDASLIIADREDKSATGPAAADGENLLINPTFEQGEEVGENVPGWRASGYDGINHIDANFVISSPGRDSSRAGLLQLEPQHQWVLADQTVPVSVDRSQAVEFSIWMRADSPRKWLALKVDPNLVQPGDNLVEVQLDTQHEPETPVVLDRLDLTVHYE